MEFDLVGRASGPRIRSDPPVSDHQIRLKDDLRRPGDDPTRCEGNATASFLADPAGAIQIPARFAHDNVVRAREGWKASAMLTNPITIGLPRFTGSLFTALAFDTDSSGGIQGPPGFTHGPVVGFSIRWKSGRGLTNSIPISVSRPTHPLLALRCVNGPRYRLQSCHNQDAHSQSIEPHLDPSQDLCSHRAPLAHTPLLPPLANLHASRPEPQNRKLARLPPSL